MVEISILSSQPLNEKVKKRKERKRRFHVSQSNKRFTIKQTHHNFKDGRKVRASAPYVKGPHLCQSKTSGKGIHCAIGSISALTLI